MKLHYSNGVFWLDCTYEEKDIAKSAKFMWHPYDDCITGCSACAAGIGAKRWWTKYPSNAARLLKYSQCTADDAAKEELEKYKEEMKKSRAANVEDKEAFAEKVPVPEGIDYFPFQKAGIEYALQRERVLIGDQMGLGKTVQALGIINATPEANRALVVCPASLRINWAREAEKWLVDDWKIFVVNKNDDIKRIPDAERLMVIVNYDKLGGKRNEKELETLMKNQWDVMIADEIHYCKSEKTQRAKAVLGTFDRKNNVTKSGLIHKANRLVFLTGTPITNRPIELWPLVRALDPQGLGSSFIRFAIRYAGAHRGRWGWDFTGASNLAELQDRLRENVMVRRLKVDVLKELPAKRRQIVELAVNGAEKLVNNQAKAFLKYDAPIDELENAMEMAETIGADAEFEEVAKQLNDLQTIAFDEMSRERHEVAMAKVPAVLEHVQGILESSDSKVIVFAHHHDVIEAIEDGLERSGRKTVTVTGNTPMQRRQNNVDAFQNNEEVRVFIGNIQAAGVGLTLTKADTVVFAELDWVPANCLQAEDRAHRIGQENAVLVQYLVFDGSVDARMAKTIVKKMEIIEAALDTENDSEKIEIELSKGRKKAERKYPVATPEQRAAAAKVVQQLSGSCDGAVKKDGVGFNKLDARFGRELAARSFARELTDGEVDVVKRLAKKYHRQVGADMMGVLWMLDDITDGAAIGNFFEPF